MKFQSSPDHMPKAVKWCVLRCALHISNMTAGTLKSGNICTASSYSPFILVFDGYIIIIFYKNASGDGSASPNAETVKLSEEL